MTFIAFIVVFLSVSYAIEQTKKQWRNAWGERARQIQADHPDWSRDQVRRRAKLRTATWWGREAAEGFPTFRQALAEDRHTVGLLRETARIGRESRLADIRDELKALREARDEHASAVAGGSTTLPFAQWYQRRQSAIASGQVGPPNPGQPTAATAPGAAPQAPVGQGAAASPGAGAVPVPGPRQPRAVPLAPRPPQSPAMPPPAAPPTKPPTAGTPQATGTSNSGVLAPTTGDFPRRPADGTEPQPVPVNPGHPAREPNPDTQHIRGEDMPEIPSGELAGDSPYQAAQAAFAGYEELAAQNEQAAETLEAQLTMHGFDRDRELMEHIRGLRESAGQIRAHAAQARQALVNHHATGAEYHQSGTDANASAFRA